MHGLVESIIVSLSYKVFETEFELKRSIACMHRKFLENKVYVLYYLHYEYSSLYASFEYSDNL